MDCIGLIQSLQNQPQPPPQGALHAPPHHHNPGREVFPISSGDVLLLHLHRFVSFHSSFEQQSTSGHGVCSSPVCLFDVARRCVLRRLGRAPGRRGRLRLWPESEVRAAVRTRRSLHPQQHMLLLPGLRRRDLPVWWRDKPFICAYFQILMMAQG